MRWLTVAYSMTAAACLTLAAVHLLVWFKQPARRTHLAFSLTAISVAAITPFEFAMARAQTAEQYIQALRWFHVPAAFTIGSVVWFLWAYFGAGRRWLAFTIWGTRVLVLILNFSLTENINFREINSVRQVALIGGETAFAAVGVLNPWHAIAQLNNLLFLLFILDVSITLWRRGGQTERRRAVVVGSSLVFFALVTGNYAVLVLAGVVTPFFVVLPFLAIVATMGYELSLDIVNAGQAERARRISEEKVQHLSGRLLHLQDEEQRRIAAELHDGLGQSLSIIRNRATLCKEDISDLDSVLEQLDEISSTAVSALDEVREIAHNLRPYELERLGLVAAVNSMLRKVSDATPLQLHSDLDQIDGLLSPAAEMSIYRIVQEGLNNVIKHAEASEARVGIKRIESEIVISIQDNGKGIDSSSRNGENEVGFGLQGIAERTRMLGGMYEVVSEPGTGTKLTIHLTCKDQ